MRIEGRTTPLEQGHGTCRAAQPHGADRHLLCKVTDHGITEIEACYSTHQGYGDRAAVHNIDPLPRGHRQRAIPECRQLGCAFEHFDLRDRQLAQISPRIRHGIQVVATGQQLQGHGRRGDVLMVRVHAVSVKEVQVHVVHSLLRGAGHALALELECKTCRCRRRRCGCRLLLM